MREGKTLISSQYANAITQVLGLPPAKSGEKFADSNIPKMIAKLIPGSDPSQIEKVMKGRQLDKEYAAKIMKTLSGENTGEERDADYSQAATKKLKQIINFYNPIFAKAAQSGWKCA